MRGKSVFVWMDFEIPEKKMNMLNRKEIKLTILHERKSTDNCRRYRVTHVVNMSWIFPSINVRTLSDA